MPKHRLTRLDLRTVLLNTHGMQIVASYRGRRHAERLIRFKLARKYLPNERDCYGLQLTPLGFALGCLITRKAGGSLKRYGVQVLARHRQQLRDRFEIERGLSELLEDLPITLYGASGAPN